MIITRDNYESFFLDYLEGNLEENLIDEFLDFLELNPDLKEELLLFENIHLPNQTTVFKGKQKLYKTSGEVKSAFELKGIALMEGDLKDEDRALFEAYLANHPELKKEHDLLLKTRLMADEKITYPHKQQLYKKSGTILLMNWVTRAAAAVLLLWGLHALLQPESPNSFPTTKQEIAAVKTPPAAPSKIIEPSIKASESIKDEKPSSSAARKQVNNPKSSGMNAIQATTGANAPTIERDLSAPQAIQPIAASLEIETDENQLAVAHSVNVQKINSPRNLMGVDEFLARRVKRAGNEGLLSATRILRTGLNVASELSGDRIGYQMKNGKITSVGFESKLMAFSIPLKKK